MGQVAVSSLVVNSTTASVSPWLHGTTSSCSAPIGPRASRPSTLLSSCRTASPRTDGIFRWDHTILADLAAGSDGLVAGLHQDLVYRYVLGLPERVNDRSGDIIGVQNARPAGRPIQFQRLPVVAHRP